MRPLRLLAAAALLALALVACDDDQGKVVSVVPQEPGLDSVAHYCGMIVANHPGPKGQIFLKGQDAPVWFASVRDTVAYTMLPDEQQTVRAIFVNDMGRATDWERPAPGTWVEARAAFYVAGSDAHSGMGGREIVPFGTRDAAERFAADHGGGIYRFGEIPERFVLGDDEEAAAPTSPGKDQSQ